MQIVLITIIFLAIGVSSRPATDIKDIKITEESVPKNIDDENSNFLTYDEPPTQPLSTPSSKTPSTVLLPPDLPSATSKTSLEIFGDDATVTLGTELKVADDKQEATGQDLNTQDFIRNKPDSAKEKIPLIQSSTDAARPDFFKESVRQDSGRKYSDVKGYSLQNSIRKVSSNKEGSIKQDSEESEEDYDDEDFAINSKPTPSSVDSVEGQVLKAILTKSNTPEDSISSREDSDESDDDDDDDDDFNFDNNGKKFGLLPSFINPGHFFDPINDKISKLAAFLTHPNGISFPFWNKLQATGSHLFGPNASIFGLGQIGGHDYPFPYRKARDVADDIRNKAGEEILNYLQKLEEAAKSDVSAILPYIEQYKKIIENLPLPL